MAIWRPTLLSKLITNLLMHLSVIFFVHYCLHKTTKTGQDLHTNAFLGTPNWVMYLLLYHILYLPVRKKSNWQNNWDVHWPFFLQTVRGCLLPNHSRHAFREYCVLTVFTEGSGSYSRLGCISLPPVHSNDPIPQGSFTITDISGLRQE